MEDIPVKEHIDPLLCFHQGTMKRKRLGVYKSQFFVLSGATVRSSAAGVIVLSCWRVRSCTFLCLWWGCTRVCVTHEG